MRITIRDDGVWNFMTTDEASYQPNTADDQITLQQAAAIANISIATLTEHAEAGRLRGVALADGWRTTRRWLHVYLLNDLGDHRSQPLPAGYIAPLNEPRRKRRDYIGR